MSEALLRGVVDVLVRLVEAAGAVVIFAGAVVGFVRFVIVAVRDRQPASFVPVRLDLGRYPALGLEFQLALLLTAGGVVCVVCAVAFAAAWRPGLHMALDLWVGAGLLRLTGDPAAADLLVAASVVAVRQLVPEWSLPARPGLPLSARGPVRTGALRPRKALTGMHRGDVLRTSPRVTRRPWAVGRRAPERTNLRDHRSWLMEGPGRQSLRRPPSRSRCISNGRSKESR